MCTTASELLDTAAARLKHESLQLLDLALFRASPAWLKRYIYNDGEWLTAGRMDVPYRDRARAGGERASRAGVATG